jgi:hypothetical protein
MMLAFHVNSPFTVSVESVLFAFVVVSALTPVYHSTYGKVSVLDVVVYVVNDIYSVYGFPNHVNPHLWALSAINW